MIRPKMKRRLGKRDKRSFDKRDVRSEVCFTESALTIGVCQQVDRPPQNLAMIHTVPINEVYRILARSAGP